MALQSNRTGGAMAHLTVPHQAAFAAAPMTLCFWYRFDTIPSVVGGSEYLGRKTNSSPPYNAWRIYSASWNDRIYCGLTDAGGAEHAMNTSVNIVPNVWQHLTYTIDASFNQELFIDGVSDATRTTAASLLVSDSILVIGGNTQWGSGFAGRIADMKIFSRVLSTPEIRTIVTVKGCDGILPGLVSHWPIKEATIGSAIGANQAVDIRSGYHASPVGGATYAVDDISRGRRK